MYVLKSVGIKQMTTQACFPQQILSLSVQSTLFTLEYTLHDWISTFMIEKPY